MAKYVWYVSYGSNLNKNRFLSYILGTTPKGGFVKEKGCRDQSLPKDMKSIILNYPMFFALKSGRWNQGGVCFIKSQTSSNHQTYGRMYLITEEQFVDVVRQENNNDELDIDFDRLDREGFQQISDTTYYGRILLVGKDGGSPIYTFTAPFDMSENDRNPPDISYLKVIGQGIKESYGLENDEIVDYFMQREEVEQSYSKEELLKIF